MLPRPLADLGDGTPGEREGGTGGEKEEGRGREGVPECPNPELASHVLVMNIAMIQPRNRYNQYYFALDSTFFEAKLTRPRPGQGQLVEAEAKI